MHIAAIHYSYFLLDSWRYSYKNKLWNLWTDLKCWYLHYLGCNHTVQAGQPEQSDGPGVHWAKKLPGWPRQEWMELHSAGSLTPAAQGSVLRQVIFNTLSATCTRGLRGILSHSAGDTVGVLFCWRIQDQRSQGQWYEFSKVKCQVLPSGHNPSQHHRLGEK